MKYFLAIASILFCVGKANAEPTAVPKQCDLPDAAGQFETAPASTLNVDQAIVNKAIADASNNGPVSIKVFRNNCLIASTKDLYPLLPTDSLRTNIFSSTKGVISILTGVAYDKGLLALDDAIDKYLPPSTNNSWGDPAHRAITIRQLLSEQAGLAKAIVSEAATVLTETSLPQEALALPLIHPPGTQFAYSQRVPDLLAYVVSRAVGQDIQAFAQENLFGPIGIPASRYTWLRDRSSNTYGYAWLFLTTVDFARIGLMMQNGGVYNGARVLSQRYVNMVSVPTPTNGCYGLLFWTNRVSPSSPDKDTCISPFDYHFNRSWFPSAPRDLYAMAGSPQQVNIMIPSLGITISWMAVGAVLGPKADTFYQFFKTLMTAIRDPGFTIPGPGTYEVEPSNITPTLEALELSVLSAGVAASPNCNILFCNGDIPVGGLLKNLVSLSGSTGDVLNTLLEALVSLKGII